jgi:hypothetical protein
VAIHIICLHDVSLMYVVWKVLMEWREEQQDNTRGTCNALTP